MQSTASLRAGTYKVRDEQTVHEVNVNGVHLGTHRIGRVTVRGRVEFVVRLHSGRWSMIYSTDGLFDAETGEVIR